MLKKEIKETGYIYKSISFRNCLPFDVLIDFIQRSKNENWEGLDFSRFEYEGEVYFYRYRMETDEEYDLRSVKEDRTKEIRRIQYENLKKEFDPEDNVKDIIENVIKNYLFEPKTSKLITQIKSEISEALNIPTKSVKVNQSAWIDSIEFIINNKSYRVSI